MESAHGNRTQAKGYNELHECSLQLYTFQMGLTAQPKLFHHNINIVQVQLQKKKYIVLDVAICITPILHQFIIIY